MSHGPARAALDHLRRGMLPLKFAYMGSAARTHDVLSRTTEYNAATGPAAAEISVLMSAIDAVPAQWCDIGPGNGQRTRALLTALREGHCRIESFLGLDISSELAALAQREMTDKTLRCSWDQWDFEAGPTHAISAWRTGTEPSVFTISGITLGNVEDPALALRNVGASMARGDFLVATVATADSKQDPAPLVAHYLSRELRAAVLEPLASAGIAPETGDLRIGFDPELSAVVGHFVFTRAVELRHEELWVRFAPGDAVRCFLSRRYTGEQMDDLVAASGFTELARASASGSNVAVLVLRR